MQKTLIFLLSVACNLVFAQITIIPANSNWKYLDNGSNQGVAWKSAAFSDVSWASGNAPLGYGPPLGPPYPPAVATTVGYGVDAAHKYPTTYFRKTITLSDTCHAYGYYKLRVRRDDGLILYVNNQEVFRDNILSPYTYLSYAATSSSDNGNDWQEIYLDGDILQKGTNVIAAEVHQSSDASPDLYFNCELLAYFQVAFQQNAIVAANDSWKYLDNGTNQGTAWSAVGFNDAAWPSANAEFGYGDGDETTIINYGPDPNNKYITTYFRKTFTTSNTYDFLRFKVKRDDGIVLFLDGNEVFRDNLSISGAISYNTLGINADDDGETWITIILKGAILSTGSHTLAAEIHQASLNSSDFSFNFELVGLTNTSTYITRGPYLMISTPTSLQIRWQTNVASDSRVKIGDSPFNLITPFTSSSVVTDHTINLTGLTPNTKYYYGLGTTTNILENLSDNFFITPPSIGTVKKTRILAMGDFGAGDQFQRQVMDGVLDKYLGYIKDNYLDVFLAIGDVAYRQIGDATDGGTMSNFQNNFFQMLQNDRLMKQTPIYPALGNHEFYNYSNSAIDFTNFNRPYFSVFNVPTTGQEGGVPSNTKRYYSFNKANIHFIVIDPFGWESYPTGSVNDTISIPHASTGGNHAYLWEANNVQKNWLKQDLAANTQKWTVVSIHTPIYSKGNHDSDGLPANDWYMPKLRDTLVRIFEKYNVDLVLSGHSHVYERSKLIKGHYGLSGTYNSSLYPAGNEVSQSTGKFNSPTTCPYIKSSTQSNGGIVYATVGAGSQLGAIQGTWPHPAVAVSYTNAHRGSLYMEIDGNQLDAKWIAEDGTVFDQFTMMKDVNVTKDLVVQENIPTTLTASYANGGFVWTNGSTVSSIIVTPPATGITTYSVHDTYGCVTDVFNVRVIPTACQSSFNVNYDINSNTTLKYETGNTIIANKTINSGANVRFDAGKSITLSPGFKTVSGTVFKAYIDGCGNLNLEKK